MDDEDEDCRYTLFAHGQPEMADDQPVVGDGVEYWVAWLSDTLRHEQEHLEERLLITMQMQLEEHRRVLLDSVSSMIEAEARSQNVEDVGRRSSRKSGSPSLELAAIPPEAEDGLDSGRACDPEDVKVQPEGDETGAAPEAGPQKVGPLSRLRKWFGGVLHAGHHVVDDLHLAHVPRWMHNHDPVHLQEEYRESLHLLRTKIHDKAKTGRCTHPMDGSMPVRLLKSEDPDHCRFIGFIKSNCFEYISGAAILACTVVMITEVRYAGMMSGHMLEIPGYEQPATERMPGARATFDNFNIFFSFIFFVEFILRIIAYRWACVWSIWMWFDGLCLLLGLLDSVGSYIDLVDPFIFRLARFARLARLLKALKAVQNLQTLYLLVRSLEASLPALFWSFVLLWCAQVITGILLSQLLRGFIDDEDEDPATRLLVFEYFGTFMNATLTMFEITLANWIVSCRLLYTNVSWAYGLFFIVYRGCFMFAVIRVITAVFLAETARCANNDDSLNVQKKQRQKEVYCRKLHAIFCELDTSHDGLLSREELMPLFCDELLKTWLQTLEIDTQDLDYLVEMLDVGDRQIDLHAFTSGMARVKGPARSVDIMKVQCHTSELIRKLDSFMAEVRQLRSPALASPLGHFRTPSGEALVQLRTPSSEPSPARRLPNRNLMSETSSPAHLKEVKLEGINDDEDYETL